MLGPCRYCESFIASTVEINKLTTLNLVGSNVASDYYLEGCNYITVELGKSHT